MTNYEEIRTMLEDTQNELLPYLKEKDILDEEGLDFVAGVMFLIKTAPESKVQEVMQLLAEIEQEATGEEVRADE
jgi:hypothetical protein